jgi:hypothetical protein
MFHSFCQQVNIVLTKDGIYTLVNVVIVDPTQTYIYFVDLTQLEDLLSLK